jgi:hypothetical protein
MALHDSLCPGAVLVSVVGASCHLLRLCAASPLCAVPLLFTTQRLRAGRGGGPERVKEEEGGMTGKHSGADDESLSRLLLFSELSIARPERLATPQLRIPPPLLGQSLELALSGDTDRPSEHPLEETQGWPQQMPKELSQLLVGDLVGRMDRLGASDVPNHTTLIISLPFPFLVPRGRSEERSFRLFASLLVAVCGQVTVIILWDRPGVDRCRQEVGCVIGVRGQGQIALNAPHDPQWILLQIEMVVDEYSVSRYPRHPMQEDLSVEEARDVPLLLHEAIDDGRVISFTVQILTLLQSAHPDSIEAVILLGGQSPFEHEEPGGQSLEGIPHSEDELGVRAVFHQEC